MFKISLLALSALSFFSHNLLAQSNDQQFKGSHFGFSLSSQKDVVDDALQFSAELGHFNFTRENSFVGTLDTSLRFNVIGRTGDEKTFTGISGEVSGLVGGIILAAKECSPYFGVSPSVSAGAKTSGAQSGGAFDIGGFLHSGVMCTFGNNVSVALSPLTGFRYHISEIEKGYALYSGSVAGGAAFMITIDDLLYSRTEFSTTIENLSGAEDINNYESSGFSDLTSLKNVTRLKIAGEYYVTFDYSLQAFSNVALHENGCDPSEADYGGCQRNERKLNASLEKAKNRSIRQNISLGFAFDF
jgi:hypothetical protein